MHHLVVSKAFGSYRAGQTITNEAEIAKISASSKCHNVVRIFAPVEAPAMPDPQPVEGAPAVTVAEAPAAPQA